MKSEMLTKEEIKKLMIVFDECQIIQIVNSFTVEQIRSVINHPSLQN